MLGHRSKTRAKYQAASLSQEMDDFRDKMVQKIVILIAV